VKGINSKDEEIKTIMQKKLKKPKKEKTILINNIGTVVSGKIDKPILESEAVLIQDGIIKAIGSHKEFHSYDIDFEIDIRGMTLCPGLIDSHTHVNIGDWSPAVNIIGWMEAALHAGVTTVISQGEFLFPGRPHDAAGVKALAILAHKVYQSYRPGGLKVHAGAVILAEGLTEHDFQEMACEGVWLVSEIGSGNMKGFNNIFNTVQIARKYGFKISTHFGPASLGGCESVLNAKEITKLNPDVIAHFNGGAVAAPLSDMKYVLEKTSSFLELICSGNYNALNESVTLLKERNELNRIILGTDTPSPIGFSPHNMMRLVAQVSGCYNIPAAIVLAMATGNTAKVFNLNKGVIEPGKEADLLVLGPLLNGRGKTALETLEAGDFASVGMIMVDGKVVTRQPKRIRPTLKNVLINGKEESRKTAEERNFGGVWLDYAT